MNLSTGVVVTGAEHEDSLHFDLPFGRVSLLSRPAPVEGRSNEDSCGLRLIDDESLLVVVSDGMGGHRGGDVASKIVVETLINNWTKPDHAKKIEHIMALIEQAHNDIKATKMGAGATLVAALITPDSVRFFNSGDSTGFLVSGHRNQKFKTLEQSLPGFAVEAGLLREEEAQEHEESHVVLNVLGFDPLRVEVTGQLEFSERDFTLLASDGLTANLLQEEVFAELSNKEDVSPLNSLAEKVTTKMLSGGHSDDLTMILVRA